MNRTRWTIQSVRPGLPASTLRNCLTSAMSTCDLKLTLPGFTVSDEGGKFFYWNDQYRDAYTNDGNLMGSWIGRDARAYLVSSTYWWSAQSKIIGSFRQTKTGSDFLPGGGTQTDVILSGQWQMRPDLVASASVQVERYLIPSLGKARSDVTARLGLTFYSKSWAVQRR